MSDFRQIGQSLPRRKRYVAREARSYSWRALMAQLPIAGELVRILRRVAGTKCLDIIDSPQSISRCLKDVECDGEARRWTGARLQGQACCICPGFQRGEGIHSLVSRNGVSVYVTSIFSG